MQADETGSIELPGAPPVTIGAALVSGGPAVTNISVSVGREGVKTRLTLKTFTPQFGSLAKRNADKFSTIGKLLQQHQRNIRNLLRTPRSGSAAGRAKYIAREASYHRVKHYLGYREGKDKPGTPHSMLVGCPYVPLDGSGLSASVVTETLYEALPDFRASVSGEYNLRAGMSWEGLLRPFSTKYTASGIPHFEEPTVSGTDTVTVKELNPFKRNHDIEYVVRGDEYPRSGLSVFEGEYDKSDNYRALAMRGPMVICGWGYSTDGKPVPNSGEYRADGTKVPESAVVYSDSFLEGYLRKFDTWKTGPLDTRWDYERKVWVAGAEWYEGYTVEELPAPSGKKSDLPYTSGEFIVYTGSKDDWGITDPEVRKLLINRSTQTHLASGTYVLATRINGELRVVYHDCDAEEEFEELDEEES